MAEKIKEEESVKISQEQIDKCLEVLEQLNSDTDQIFEIPKNKSKGWIIPMDLGVPWIP